MLPGWEDLGVEPHPLTLEKMGVGFPDFLKLMCLYSLKSTTGALFQGQKFQLSSIYEACALSLLLAHEAVHVYPIITCLEVKLIYYVHDRCIMMHA